MTERRWVLKYATASIGLSISATYMGMAAVQPDPCKLSYQQKMQTHAIILSRTLGVR